MSRGATTMPGLELDLPFDPECCRVAGVDEAGRGCLAGRVVAAAVILDSDWVLDGLDDSKRIPAKRRQRLAREIKRTAVAWATGMAEVDEIDRLNILQASLLAMRRAVAGLSLLPDWVLVDGNVAPALPCNTLAIVRGDQKSPAIAAASIIAKVSRDEEMERLHLLYPEYGFMRNKGYGTDFHRRALRKYGVSDIHRRSFTPVRELLQ